MSSFWSRNISLSIFGESHGPAIGVVIDNLPPGEYIDLEKLRQAFPVLPMEGVPGNCDYGSCDQPERLIELGGVRILMLHGHTRGVKSDAMRAVWAARECGAQVLLFGHTHRPMVDNDGALLVLNPGAAGDPLRPTCGLLTIENGKADVGTLAI